MALLLLGLSFLFIGSDYNCIIPISCNLIIGLKEEVFYLRLYVLGSWDHMNLKYYEVYPRILGILELRILKTLVLRTFYPK